MECYTSSFEQLLEVNYVAVRGDPILAIRVKYKLFVNPLILVNTFFDSVLAISTLRLLIGLIAGPNLNIYKTILRKEEDFYLKYQIQYYSKHQECIGSTVNMLTIFIMKCSDNLNFRLY